MQTLTINGKEYAVKFSYSVILDFCEKQGIEIYEFKGDFKIQTNAGIKQLSTFVRLAMLRGAEITGSECAITVNDVVDAIFEDGELLTKVLQAIQNDMPVKKKESREVPAG